MCLLTDSMCWLIWFTLLGTVPYPPSKVYTFESMSFLFSKVGYVSSPGGYENRSLIRLASGSFSVLPENLSSKLINKQDYPPKIKMSPKQGTVPKGKFIFPSIFSGYVSFQWRYPQITNHSRSYFEVIELFIGFFSMLLVWAVKKFSRSRSKI